MLIGWSVTEGYDRVATFYNAANRRKVGINEHCN